MNMFFLEKLFALLSNNLLFPYYQGERRIDIFINFFIEDIIRQHTPFRDAKFLLPEFPIKKNDLTDHAAHIDYLLYSPASKKMIMVELKTDDTSYLNDQIQFYLKHPHFFPIFEKCKSIKMRGYSPKKKKLIDTINAIKDINLRESKIVVVVLKPTVTQTDSDKQVLHLDKLFFIPLSKIDIETKCQNEWNVFRETVLVQLAKQPKLKNKKMIMIG